MALGEQSSEKKFQDIKYDFFKAYKENIGLGKYHKLDLERLRKNNDWLKAFYKYAQENHERTVNMLDEVLIWRNEFGCNDLLVGDDFPVPEEMFKRGGMFVRNEDINCITMLHFLAKLHKKDMFPQANLFKFISYYFEKMYRFNLDDPVVLVFDMSDAGYSNLDMDMIKFVVTCLKTYYPGLIDYMIVYQMPFIFNAAWKIIKNWLPPNAVNLIKFCDKKSIKEYIQESQLFTHMGGTDNYKYVYDKKAIKAIKSQALVASEILQSKTKPAAEPLLRVVQSNTELKLTADTSIENNINSLSSSKSNQELGEMNNIPVSNDQEEQNPQQNTLQTSPSKSKISNEMSNIVINKIFDATYSNETSLENILNTPLLSINPGEELIFNVTDARQDITQFIKLTNTSKSCLAYKIKITSPDKFRVKPGTGIIPTSSNAQIMINFLKEFQNSVTNHRDKFLILWTVIDESLQTSDLNDFWKQASLKKQNINEHKVKCLIKRNNNKDDQKNLKINKSPSSNDTKNVVVQSLPVSPSNLSVNTYFSPKENSKNNISDESKNTNTKKKATSSVKQTPKTTTTVSPSVSPVPIIAPVEHKKISKIDKLEIKNLVETKDQTVLAQKQNYVQQNSSINDSRHRFDRLERDMDSLIDNQQKLNTKYSQIIYLVYFLVMLNVLQLLFQSNLFTKVIEPYIDSLLFDSN